MEMEPTFHLWRQVVTLIGLESNGTVRMGRSPRWRRGAIAIGQGPTTAGGPSIVGYLPCLATAIGLRSMTGGSGQMNSGGIHLNERGSGRENENEMGMTTDTRSQAVARRLQRPGTQPWRAHLRRIT